MLTDAEGVQYAVFAPEKGGTFAGMDFEVTVAPGVVPSGEFVGVRMAETGDASNAGMSQHRYTLSGNQYTVSIIDSEGSPISVYALNAPLPYAFHYLWNCAHKSRMWKC